MTLAGPPQRWLVRPAWGLAPKARAARGAVPRAGRAGPRAASGQPPGWRRCVRGAPRQWRVSGTPARPVGAVGPVGPEGPVGAVGPEGPVGPQGPEGPEGAVGPPAGVLREGPAQPVAPPALALASLRRWRPGRAAGRIGGRGRRRWWMPWRAAASVPSPSSRRGGRSPMRAAWRLRRRGWRGRALAAPR